MHLHVFAKVLTIGGWDLMFTAIGVITPIVIMIIGIEMSRRKDIKKQLDTKANIIYVDKEIKDCMRNHEKVHDETNKQFTQIQSDLTLIKNYIMSKS